MGAIRVCDSYRASRAIVHTTMQKSTTSSTRWRSAFPNSTRSPLRAQPPAGHRATRRAALARRPARQQQGLLVYEEWKEYFGGVPALRPLAGIDLSGYNENFVFGLLQDIDWSQASVDPSMLQYELPFWSTSTRR
jgi:hypothetical protein